MKAVIAQYFKKRKNAFNQAEQKKRLWKGKIAWYVIEAVNGYFVVSEGQARKCFPQLQFSLKTRRYKLNGSHPTANET